MLPPLFLNPLFLLPESWLIMAQPTYKCCLFLKTFQLARINTWVNITRSFLYDFKITTNLVHKGSGVSILGSMIKPLSPQIHIYFKIQNVGKQRWTIHTCARAHTHTRACVNPPIRHYPVRVAISVLLDILVVSFSSSSTSSLQSSINLVKPLPS